jgi:hypothetical protein
MGLDLDVYEGMAMDVDMDVTWRRMGVDVYKDKDMDMGLGKKFRNTDAGEKFRPVLYFYHYSTTLVQHC